MRLTALTLVALLAACSRTEPTTEPVRSVKVMTVGQSSPEFSPEFAGEVRPRVESRLGFRVGGKLVKRSVEVGQRVRAGQPLAQLDAQDYQLSADAARAQLAAASTNRDLAAADYKRFKELRDQNFISGAELERRESTLKAAQAQYDQARAQLSGQTNQAGYTTLVADASGVVTAVDAEVGQVVAAGTPVVRIAQDGARDVVFSVPEDKVAMVRAGTAAEVRAWTRPDAFKGTVREVAASADPVTRTYTVKVSVNGTEELALGTTVSVKLQALSHDAVQVIKLPTSALRQDGGKTAVWVLDTSSMTVKSVPVEVNTADGNSAVVTAGLSSGMQVVVAGVHVLSPGQKVTLYKERVASASPSGDSAAPATAGK